MVILEGELSGLAGEVLLIDTQTRECIVKLTNGSAYGNNEVLFWSKINLTLNFL
jgi:hypothetical protein